MDTYQYRDLPQIPSFSEEPQYLGWPHEHMAYQQQPVHIEADYESGRVGASGIMRMQAVERFLVEPSPLTPGMLHAKLDRNMSLYNQQIGRYEQWPAPEHARYDSPGTSVSDNSSYVTQNEVRSPHAYHSASYGSPEEYTQATYPYPSADQLREPSYSRDLPPGSGSISLRDIEYEHEPEHEPIIEEAEPIHLKTDVVYEQEPVRKMESAPTVYNEYSDSSVSNSLRDGESVQPIPQSEEETSDTEYTPNRSNRRRRSSASTNGSGRTGQRRRSYHGRKNSASTPTHRVNKRGGRSSASYSTAKGSGGSQVNGDSQRHFPCPLATYGCQSTFSSKNEWKRHVSTQHIKLGFWRCNLCVTTVDPHDEHTIYHNDFNRKDLFMQHLRRMHAAPSSHSASRTQKEYPVTEDNITDHQKQCFHTLRDTPQRSNCLFCHERFEGPNSWEIRMEHIGKHLEKDRKEGLKLGNVDSWIVDSELEQWLLDEGIIAVDKNGQWKIGDGKSKTYTHNNNEESDGET